MLKRARCVALGLTMFPPMAQQQGKWGWLVGLGFFGSRAVHTCLQHSAVW